MRFLLLPLALVGGHVAQPSFDIVIRQGTVVDGSGRPAFRADVGIRGDRIAAIGDLSRATAATTIAAEGLMVTPGFINLHSHANPDGLRVADNMLSQGVTTEILFADGHGPLDVKAALDSLRVAGTVLNVAGNIGFNSVWTEVVGERDRRPTSAELERMQQMILKNLEQGAAGVSSGLDYKPGYFAREEEVVQILSPARVWRTNFPNHDRVRPETRFSARAAVQETMRIGEKAGLVPVITHMKVTGRERRQGQVVLGEMAAATKRGVYTAADVYPYLSGLTGLGSLIIPGWAQDGGVDSARRRFRDPALRKRIIEESDETIASRFTGPQGIKVLSSGKYLTAYMQEFGTSSPGEAIVKILEKDMPAAILGFGDEQDLIRILQYPASAVSCDCGATVGPTGHPRNYGTFPRVLGRYVREQHVLTWEEAVRKMSALPATIVGLPDRGYLAVGMAADVTVFDTATVMDHATFESPGVRSTGIRHVLVNGRPALRDGIATGDRSGSILLRSRWMPTRPQDAWRSSRSFDARGTVSGSEGAPFVVRASLRQARTQRAAAGTLTIRSPGFDFNGQTFGVIQRANRWMSVTGIATVDGSTHPFTLTIDAGDPAAPGTRTLILDLDGTERIRGALRP